MKILLIAPTHQYKFRFPAFLSITDFPVGLAYVAAALRAAGHDVHGLNPNNRTDFTSAAGMVESLVGRALAEVRPELVCTGGLCTDYPFVRDVIALVRKLSPDTPLAIGGGLVTHDPEFVFDRLRPDFAVVGEAEDAMVRLAASLAGDRHDHAEIPNLLYREGGERKATRTDLDHGDPDRLAFPAHDLFGASEMIDRFSLAARYQYRYPRDRARPMVLVSGRSCPFSCTFCVHNRAVKYRARGLPSVVKELTHLHETYRFNVLIILDELFALKQDRLREFSEAVIEGRRTVGWDFHWTFQTHASAAFDREALELARQAGCFMFSYGIESASPAVLKSMNKRTTPEQVARGITLAREARVGFGGNFIFGDPVETEQTVAETMRFMREHCDGVHLSFGSIQPYPGSLLFQQCLERGIIPDRLTYYDTIDERRYNMTALPEKPWLRWMSVAGFLGTMGLWLRPARAAACRRGAEGPLDVLELTARCPCCGESFEYRHAVAREQRQTTSLVGQRGALMRWVMGYKSHPLFLSALLATLSLVSLVQPLFRLLAGLRGRGWPPANSVVTGCPSCHQCIRLEWTA